MEAKPEWWDRYFAPWPQEVQDFEQKYKGQIDSMIHTTNSTDKFDSSTKMEPFTRSITYSGKNIPTTTFTDKY